MNIKEIFFVKREVKNGGVFLHLKKDVKEKIGVPLLKISENIVCSLDSEFPASCFDMNGMLKSPSKEALDYHIDKIYKISSEHFIGEDVTVYVIKIHGDENTIGLMAYPEELEK